MGGSTMSWRYALSEPDTSPGRVNPGKLQIATLAARPMPNSCMPPHHTGISRARHRSWTRRASPNPPSRLTLILMIRQLPRSSALRRGGGQRPRYARTDLEIGGVAIKAGDLVLLEIGGANLDPSVFAGPVR